jgi:DNA gyrase subunit B
VKLGGRETYLVKDSELEDLLVRERFPDIDIETRDGTVKLTEARYQRFQRALAEFEGWSARLRSDFGAPAAEFVIGHRVIESPVDSPAALATYLEGLAPNGYTFAVTGRPTDVAHVKVTELETSAAQEIAVPRELFDSPIYQHVRRTYARLQEVIGGSPPFKLALGKKTADAYTYEELRHRSLDLAKEGIQISRFKGLGEMNYQQLWDTTMDPQRRMLIRVDVEDASRADLWFSRLMGDQVEPRKDFIEQNANDVRFLDV